MKRLKKIYIEITNICNLSCAFCPPHSRRNEFMGIETFRRIIDKIRDKTGTLYFHVKGEPFLHPDLPLFIDIAAGAGFSVILTTNGTLIREKSETLSGKTNLKRINISLHSLPQFSPPQQEKMTKEILAASKALVESNRKVNPDFLVSLRLWTKDNIEETRHSIALIEDSCGLEKGSIEQRLAGRNSMIIQEGLVIHTAETFVWPSFTGTDFGGAGHCLALRDQAAILVDGTVVPCCLDGDGSIPLGNILEENWDGIMEAERGKALYKGFSDRKITENLCRRCGFRTRFSVSPTLTD